MKAYIYHIAIDRDGYDNFGGYWGVGKAIWQVDTADSSVCLRADTAEQAMAMFESMHLRNTIQWED